VIGRFLNNPMRAAVRYCNLPSGAVFQEYTISHPNLLGIGYISGSVDYLVASTVGDMRPKETGGVVLSGPTRFLVMEARQGAMVMLAVLLKVIGTDLDRPT
jgi:hypothetical protein